MKSWYKYAQMLQEEFPFYQDIPVQEPPVPEAVFKAPKTPEMLDEVIGDCEDYNQVITALKQNGFDWQEIKFPQDVIITVNINGQIYVIDDFYLPTSEEGDEWVNNKWEHELYTYIPPSEDDDFWQQVGKGFTVYHATSSENVNSIMREGLLTKNESRGISNRGTGSAVFTSDNPNDIDSYGDTILAINVGQMKEDGYTPTVSKETPVEESQARSALAHKIGLTNYEPSNDYASEGIYDTTIIFFGSIPPKYITVT